MKHILRDSCPTCLERKVYIQCVSKDVKLNTTESVDNMLRRIQKSNGEAGDGNKSDIIKDEHGLENKQRLKTS